MNAQNAKDFLTLVQALMEGKTIQTQYGEGSEMEWRDEECPSFICEPSFYRIKSEPRRWWLTKSSYINRDLLVAVEYRERTAIPNYYIEVVEVLK